LSQAPQRRRTADEISVFRNPGFRHLGFGKWPQNGHFMVLVRIGNFPPGRPKEN